MITPQAPHAYSPRLQCCLTSLRGRERGPQTSPAESTLQNKRRKEGVGRPSARCAARSFTGSIDTDRTVMTESYFPFNVTDSEEITALPTEFVSTATSSTRGTVTEWGNSASTEITDPLPGFSKEQQPPTEADSATEVNANTDSSSRSSENSSHFSDNPFPYTEESNSSQTYSQGFTREGRSGSTVNGVSTNGATSPRFDQSDTTSGFLSSHSPTNESAHSETGLPSDISQQSSGTASDSTQNSTPPLTVTNSRGREGADVTDSGYTSQAGTSQMETGSPVPHKEDHAPNTSRPGKESAVTTVSAAGTTTESSTGPFRPPAVDHTEDDAEQASSTAPPRVNDTVTTMDVSRTESPAHTQPFTPETEVPADSTEVLATATQTNQFAEEDTFRTTTGATTTPSTPAATTSMYQPSTSIEPSTQPTITTTTAPSPTTPGPQATPSTSQHLPPSRTGETSTHSSAATSAISTDITTLHLETSTATPGKTTHRGRHTTASYSNTAPSRTTPAHTTGNLTDRATTTFEATTTQMHIISTVATGSPCDSNPCGNGGTCVAEGGNRPKCLCLPSWTGSECDEDMDECVTGPCPPGSSCMNMRGSFSCVCPLGSDLENGRACTRARTFLGTFQLSNVHLNSTHPMSAGLHELQREIAQLLNNSLSSLKGYSRSTLNKREGEGMRISAVHTFSMSAEVTRADVTKSIETVLESCRQAVGHCRVVLHHTLQYTAESLCAARKTQCDTDRSNCTDTDGTTFCQCRAGYFKHNTEDQSCRECNDGYKLENGTCVRCTFGFGGFNCGNFYKLITVVVSPAGGALLLILVIALIVTCCKKDKNDINKIIFKSGDFQISPYAEYPKSNRVSMEWGRETIEMQENGSTKNLLQMTDIYYSPALRNSELERSGLYPFSGMPGSRHSCIYPAQWNPSFISDDTRRRDYF
ncbi:hypothetical protein AAFF_G00009060 [Aldrovandia affinis]|uniref:EGF-like domain-containing protein n=1 Tax=Aldrovandia affinis TaxID=143900 RepID=A0AAD7T6Q8_9TELE|nr:hypothetical protein AAFF_G00009060 [Aldrovandia affinis]